MSAPQPKTVVMACSHPYWSVLQVGSQHLARQFARHGWQVHYFSAPITPLHLLKLSAPEVLQRFKRVFDNPSIHENGMIHSHVPFSLIAPDGRFPLRSKPVTRSWHKTLMPSLWQRIQKAGINRVSLLYIDNISYHFLIEQLSFEKSIFRVMDMHERFPGWEGEARLLAEKIARKADVTAYSANGLKSYIDRLGPNKAILVPNGVDFDLFDFNKNRQHRKRPAAIQHIPDPIALYTGIIDSRIDFNVIKTAAKQLPRVSFVLAGPAEAANGLSGLPANVYTIGPVPHPALPDLMRSAAAGLIPFDVENQMDAIKGIRPLKLFEYMAAGLPVISARWPEVEEIGGPAWFYDNAQEFVSLLQKALHPQEFDPAIARRFAGRFDWKKVFEALISNIDSL